MPSSLSHYASTTVSWRLLGEFLDNNTSADTKVVVLGKVLEEVVITVLQIPMFLYLVRFWKRY